jgi:hypothetical protein
MSAKLNPETPIRAAQILCVRGGDVSRETLSAYGGGGLADLQENNRKNREALSCSRPVIFVPAKT